MGFGGISWTCLVKNFKKRNGNIFFGWISVNCIFLGLEFGLGHGLLILDCAVLSSLQIPRMSASTWNTAMRATHVTWTRPSGMPKVDTTCSDTNTRTRATIWTASVNTRTPVAPFFSPFFCFSLSWFVITLYQFEILLFEFLTTLLKWSQVSPV